MSACDTSGAFTAELPADFSFTYQRRASLTPQGRVLWCGLIGANAMVVATGCALIGAWPVVPFAGLEVLLVAAAFYWVGRSDGDEESFIVSSGQFTSIVRRQGVVTAVTGNIEWARLVLSDPQAGGSITLRYAGKTYSIAQHIPEAERIRLAAMLRSLFRVSIA